MLSSLAFLFTFFFPPKWLISNDLHFVHWFTPATSRGEVGFWASMLHFLVLLLHTLAPRFLFGSFYNFYFSTKLLIFFMHCFPIFFFRGLSVHLHLTVSLRWLFLTFSQTICRFPFLWSWLLEFISFGDVMFAWFFVFCAAFCSCLCIWGSKDLIWLYRLILMSNSLLLSGPCVDNIVSGIIVQQPGAGLCSCCWFHSKVYSWEPVTRGTGGHEDFLVFEWTGLFPGRWSLGLVMKQKSASWITVGLLPGVQMGVPTFWSLGELLTGYSADLSVDTIRVTLWLTGTGMK